MRSAIAWACFALVLTCIGLLPRTAVAQSGKPKANANAGTAEAAGASDEVARGLFQAGKAAYEAGNYTDALSFFEQAHARSGRPQLLFNVGQTADRLRQDEKAIASFRAYLEQLPEAPNRAEVEARIRALEQALAERRRSAETAPVAASLPAPTPEQTAAQAPAAAPRDDAALGGEPAQSKPVTQQWWFCTGLGAVVVGGTAVALAVALGGDAGREPYYEGNGGSLPGP